jgi:hypothetical protein
MFGFLKKLFGGDLETNKAAGVQIEQVPHKVEVPVVENKVAVVNDQPIVKTAEKPAAMTAAKKPAAPKKEGAKKPAAKKEGAKKPATRGRKPKAPKAPKAK